MEEQGFKRFRNAERVWWTQWSAQWFSSMQDLLGNINTARLNRPMYRTAERCDVYANLKFVYHRIVHSFDTINPHLGYATQIIQNILF